MTKMIEVCVKDITGDVHRAITEVIPYVDDDGDLCIHAEGCKMIVYNYDHVIYYTTREFNTEDKSVTFKEVKDIK